MRTPLPPPLKGHLRCAFSTLTPGKVAGATFAFLCGSEVTDLVAVVFLWVSVVFRDDVYDDADE